MRIMRRGPLSIARPTWYGQIAMSRIGELLVAAGHVTAAAVAEALHAQVMWGGRLGTSLVELGHVDLDALSQALGRQHGLPPALGKHFDRADPTLQTQLSANLAESYACVPLVRVGKRVVIASIAPLGRRATAVVADELGVEADWIIASIAPELRIRYFLESVYKIPRLSRFLRVRGGSRSESPMFGQASHDEVVSEPVTEPVADVEPELELPTLPDPPPAAVADAGRERRHYVHTLADTLETHPDRDSILAAVNRLGESDTRPPTDGNQRASAQQAPTSSELAETVRTIEQGHDREAVAQLVMDAVARLEPSILSAMLLVVRGTVAATLASFCRDHTALEPVAVPLDHPGLVSQVIKSKSLRRGTSADLTPVDYLLIVALGVEYGDLVVAPISVSGQVAAIIVLAGPRGIRATCVDAIVTAAGSAFERLMREATRRRS